MRVFVTGAAGFIGAHVCRILLERKHEVHALLLPGECRTRTSAFEDRCVIHEADLGEPAEIEVILAETRPEAAIHLAWYAVPGEYWTSPKNLECVAQGMELARMLSNFGCRKLVGAGTCAEYDWSHEVLVEGETPCNPRTLYGAAKHALFLVLSKFCEQAGMQFAWTRFGFLYGPQENPGRLVPTVIDGLLEGADVPCTEGIQERDFLHVGDAASATIAVLEGSVQGAVNIGAGAPVPIRTVVELLAEIIGGPGRPRFGELPSRPEDPHRLVPSLLRLNEVVGWTPSLPLQSGLEQTVESARLSRG